MTCPNKNHPDWIELVNKIGEEAAMAAYLRNGEEIPNPKTYKAPPPVSPEINKIFNNVVVPGFNINTQEQATMFLTEQILIGLSNSRGQLSFNQVASAVLAELKIAESKGNTKMTPLIQNFDQFRDLVKRRLDLIGLLSKTYIDPSTTAGKVLENEDGDVYETFYWKDDWVFEFDSKANAQKQIKEFLLFIPNTVWKEGEKVEQMNYLGTIDYLRYDEVFEELKGLLADVPNTWEEMEARLHEVEDEKPWIANMLFQIDNHEDPDHIRNQFVVTFSSTHNNFKTLIWDEEKGYYTFRLVDTDQGSITNMQLNKWKNEFYNSDLFEYDEEDNIKPNEEKVKAKIKELNELRDKPEGIKAFLKSIGIEVSDKVIDQITNGKFNGLSYKYQFTSKSGLFYLIKSRLQGNDPKGEVEDVINPVINNSAVRLLATVESRNNPALFSNSMRNGEGNTVYSYSFNKLITRQLRKFKDDAFVKRLANISFNKPIIDEGEALYNSWINQLVTNKDLFIQNFNVSPFDTVKPSSKRGTKLSRLGDTDLEITMWELFQKGHKVDGLGTMSNFLFTIPSKTTSYIFQAPKLDFQVSSEGDLDQKAKDALYSIALSELSRINTAEKRKKKLVTNKYKNGYNRFYMFPILNKETSPELWNKKQTAPLLPTTKLADGRTVEQAIRAKIEADIKQDIKEKLQYWEQIGITKDGVLQKFEGDAKQSPLVAATDFVVNHTLFNFNMHQTFIGDPALYFKGDVEKTWDEIGKRLAAQIAPGKDLALRGRERFISIKAKDREGNIALNIAELNKLLGAKAQPYTKLNGTDAQEFTTWQEALFVAYRLGELTTQQYGSLTAKLRAGEILNAEELSIVFKPRKPVYTNLEINDDEDALVLEYVKSSSIPLLPQFTEGLELDKLRIAMEKLEREQKLPVRLSFDSATKVGGVESVEIFNDDGTIKANLDFTNFYKSLDREGFTIQQDIPHDPEADETVKATQATKLLFDSVLGLDGFEFKGQIYKGKELKDKWNILHKDMFQLAADELRLKLTNPDGTINIPKAQKMLYDEALKRGYTPAELASLALDPSNKDFEYPFWAVNSATKFEALLTSLFTNNIVRQKMHGQSLVLVSEEGMKGRSFDIHYTPAYDPETGLKPMRQDPTTGETLPAQVILPWNYKSSIKNFLDSDGKIDLKKLPQELLERFGFRIPNQGQNSMALIEVVGFLPEGMNDIAIATRNFIIQMGSDFDVDKLYVYDYYVKETAGGITKDVTDRMEIIKNDIFEIHKAVLKNPKVFENVVTPLGNSKDTDSAQDIKDFLKKKTRNFLTPAYKRDKYLESIDGKSMVAMESLASTFNTLLQEIEDVHLQRRVVDRETGRVSFEKTYIYFGDEQGNEIALSDLSGAFNIKGETKNSVISAGQSAAVDNEKDPILFYLNRNVITAPVLNALRQLGLTEDYINYLLNQAPVREFVDLQKKSKRTIGKKTKIKPEEIIDQIVSRLEEEYVKTLDPASQRNWNRGGIYRHPLTVKEMQKNMKQPDLKMNLIAMLKFKQAYRVGKTLQQVQSAISIESSGVGRSVLEIENKVRAIARIGGIENITNISKIAGDITARGLENPTTVSGHTLENGLIFADETLNTDNKLFKYGSRSFQKVLDEVQTLLEEPLDDEGIVALWEQFKGYTLAKPLVEERSRIFVGKENLPNRVKALVNSPEGRNNPFLIRLTFDTRSGHKYPNLINYQAAKEEYIDELNIYRGFLELFMSPNEETRQIAEDLVTYFYLNGGIQKAKEWGKYIHPDILKEYKDGKFLKYLREVNFSDETVAGEGENISNFTEQYFRHNPWLLPTVDTKSKLVKKDKTKLTIDSPTTDTSPVSRINEEYPEMVTIENRNAAKGREIYKKVSVDPNGRTHYERVSALGKQGFVEYSGEKNATSLTNHNYISKETPKLKEKISPKNDTKKIINPDLAALEGTINEALNKIDAGKWKPLVDVLKKIEYKGNILLDAPDNVGGYYSTKTGDIHLHAQDNEIDRILMHEIVHAATIEALQGKKSLTKEQQKAVASLKTLVRALRERTLQGEFEHLGLTAKELERFELLNIAFKNDNLSVQEKPVHSRLASKYYGLSNINNENAEEFVAQLMSDKTFQKILNQIPYDDKRTLLDRIIELITEFLAAFGAKEGTAFEAGLRDAIIIIGDKGRTYKPKPVISAEPKVEEVSIRDEEPPIDTLEPAEENENPFEESKPKMIQGSLFDNAEKGTIFNESPSSNYADRTKENASADATIAIAVDMNTAGEKATRRAVLDQNKKYVAIDDFEFDKGGVEKAAVERTVKALNEANAKTLNIAGNGIYTFKGWEQEEVDRLVYLFLKEVLNHPNLKNKIELIRSGGQTGVDEAGIKAGQKLGIPTLVLAPKGWKFRTKEGVDISNEKQFKARFKTNSVRNLFSKEQGPAFAPRSFAKQRKEEYAKILDRYRDRLKFVERAISKAINDKNQKRIEELKERHAEIEAEIAKYKDKTSFDSVIELAETDLANVKEMLKSQDFSHNDVNYMLRVIKTWTALDTILSVKDNDPEEQEKIDDIVGEANTLYTKWSRVAKNAMLQAVKAETGMEHLTQAVLDSQEKINALTANAMDISRTGSILLSVMDKWMRDSTKKAVLEARGIEQDLEEILKDLQKNADFKKDGFYVFAQRTEDGELTGELVRPLKPEYFKTRNDLIEEASKAQSKKAKAEAWKKYFKWVKDNHIIVDITKLYKETDSGYTWSPDEEYLKQLQKELGPKYEDIIEEQKKKIEYYNERLETVKETVDKDDPESYRVIEKWKVQNDPTIYIRNVLHEDYTKTTVDGEYIKNEGHEYVVKRANKEWEDAQYDKIQGNKELKAFYDFAVKTLNDLYSYLPAGFKEGITPTTIPSIAKSTLETMHEAGYGTGFNKGWDKIIEGISVSDTERQTNALLDPLTNKPELNLRVRYLNNLSAKERSYDLGKVIKVFALEALAFKHKSRIEDSVRLAQSILEQSLEIVRSPKGDEIKTRFGETLKVNDLKNLKEQVEYAIEAWYGKRKDTTQGVTRKKVYTNSAKKKHDALMKDAENGKFTKESVAYIESIGFPALAERMKKDKPSKATIERAQEKSLAYLEANTRYVAGYKIGDQLLKYMQLKGMGFNIFSSFTNAAFGWLSNYNWAAGGRDFTTKELAKANRIMLSTTLKSSTGIANANAKKVSKLMQKFDVLKEFNEDAYNPTTNANAVRKGMQKLSPYELQRRGEYFVQGMTMVASMMHTKVMKDGKEVSLWDAYDNEGNFTGDAKEQWQGDIDNKEQNKEFFKFSNHLDQVNKGIHGNYDPNSAVRMKKGVLGRAIMQFRSWIAEGAANRFEGKKFDLLLGRERKGRWRTYTDLGFKGSLQALIKTALGKELKGMGDPAEQEITVENMKRNLVELYQTLILLGLYFVLKGIELDDDDEWSKRANNFMINQILRLQDDIEFYYSPMALENITQNAVPVFNLVRDGWKFVDAVGDGVVHGEWDYQGGRKRGQNKILWTGAKLLPFSSTMASFINKTEQEEGFRK